MIEKIEYGWAAGQGYIDPTRETICDKINELVDAINKHEDIIRQIGEWGSSKGECLWCETQTEVNLNDRMIGCATLDIPESYNELHKAAENVPGPIKLYVCADGSVYDNLDVAKSHAASIFNPLPAGATTTDRAYLEQELIRTRKELDVAVDALKQIREINIFLPQIQMIDKALEQITALEQKDVK